MAAPTFGGENETVWNVNTTPKSSSVTVGAGDVMVMLGGTADSTATLGTPTGGTGLTWTLKQSITSANMCAAYGWTTTSSSSQTFTAQIARSGATLPFWGFNCLEFTASNGIGATASTSATNAAPSLTFSTTQANSAIVVFNLDWAAVDGASRTWRTPSGSTGIVTGGAGEVTYFRDNTQYTVYGGYHSDAGAAGSKTVGLSAPAGQTYSIIAIEVLGTTSSGVTFPPVLISQYGGFH